MPKVICSTFYFPVMALKSTTNLMSFLYKPEASRHQFLDLTFPFFCQTDFQEVCVILQSKHAEYDKSFC